MCGIAFIYDPDLLKPELTHRMQRCLDHLKHRGPDESNLYGQANWVAGHRRLSIIDIAASHQPMRDPSGNYSIVFNGEIYNYKELRRELHNTWEFTTNGDTEVALAGLCLQGEQFLSKMLGMWAIAFWDNSNKKLLLTRDRIGKKPLYYFANNRSIACCSELPALQLLIKHPIKEDLNSTADYFRYGFYLPGHTAYEEIKEVLPGHYLLYKPGEKQTQISYWKLKRRNFSGTRQDAIKAVRSTFITAVQRRMTADVEIGAFLSGGIDSSVIVAAMAKELELKPKTFTIGFDNPSYDERKYAHLIAAMYNTEHHERAMSEFKVEHLTKHILEHHGQPFGDASLLPTAMLSKLAAQHVKVVLSGDGGDEIFSGYQRYQSKLLLSTYLNSPHIIRKLIEVTLDRMKDPSVHHSRSLIKKAKLFIDSVKRESNSPRYIAPLLQSNDDLSTFSNELAILGHTPPIQDVCNSDAIMEMMYADVMTYLPQDILAKVDRASMAFSLETRAPFLDIDLIELCFSFPRTWHRRGISGKRILKESFYNYIPNKIWHRRKQGFAVPLSNWFKTMLGQQLRELLLSSHYLPLNKTYIENLIQIHQSGRKDYSMLLWAIYVYLLWREAL